MKILKLCLKILLLSSYSISYAQCLEQKKFNINWKIENSKIEYSIQSKNRENFSYYDIQGVSGEAFIGINFSRKLKLIPSPYIQFMGKRDSIEYKRIKQLLLGKGNDQISPMLDAELLSQTYNIPLEDYLLKTTNKFSNEYVFENELPRYKTIYKDNNIYGKEKIRLYILLLHTNTGDKCSYFESPEIEYDFGMKPLSLVWKDFWNK